MIALLQRVRHASVQVADKCIAEIDQGLLVFIGVEKNDNESDADRLIERLLGYRVFADADGKMNLSVSDIAGSILLVPQFTLAADTRKGTRPSFYSAASPELGQDLFAYLVDQTRQRYPRVATGEFGADMQVGLLNDGPVTFWLQT
jgi:D-tyrosyl-tRNA(Tyr) deacylase